MSRVPLRRCFLLALVTGALAVAPVFAAKGGKAQVIAWEMSPSADVDMDARGNLQWKGPAGKAHFNVTVQSIDEGTYSFELDGSSVATFDVGSDGNGQLRLKEKNGTLGFDPRGGEVAVSKEGIVYLTATFPASVTEAHALETEIEAELAPTGAVPAAAGAVEFEFAHGESEFEVEVSNLPEGTYDVLVGGVVVGQITVNADGGGEIEFGLGGNDSFLAFDPRGQLVQVAQGGTVILEVQFPAVATDDDQSEDEDGN